VEIWEILSWAPGTKLTKETVSPPPQTVVEPFLQAATIAYKNK